MASIPLILVQETILSQDDDILYEVIDDQKVELSPMGVYRVWLATVLVVHLANFARQHQLGRAVQEMLFDFTATLKRKRRPDAAFVSFDRWPQQRRIPRTEAWEVVPNLAVEVVSPSDTIEHVMEKVAEYFQVGVECVWVILPSQEHIYVYESPTSVHILSRQDILHGEPVLPQFQLLVAELFDDMEAPPHP
jgi:Uma2 family endonuclease